MRCGELAVVLERAAELLEAEGYDRRWFHRPSRGWWDRAGGCYCQAGAIAKVLGYSPAQGVVGGAHFERAYHEAGAALHPGAVWPPWWSESFQAERYPGGQREVVRHMREVAAELAEQPAREPARRERVPA